MGSFSSTRKTIFSSKGVRVHWYILLVVSLSLLLIGLTFGGYQLWEVYTGEFFISEADDVSATTVSRQEVEEVLSEYVERRALFERSFSTPSPRDPS